MINSLFIAWTVIYGEALSTLVGPAIFAGLHYVVGAFVTSLPEVVVAVENYEKLTSPDLNTAFSSATQSNMTNLVIALIGSLLGALFLHMQLIQEI
ncbi:MAG: hypothetical protein HC921_21850 [Synechococcaceae cyanobacterium SM2_3_1]|nr:hypothetical protein [Synechococcaceae cyanobacterium SM2_3_1]